MDGNPWEENLTLDQVKKIKDAKNPADIKSVQQEIAWEIFFAVQNIVDGAEKKAWREDSGLTIQEAKTAYGKG